MRSMTADPSRSPDLSPIVGFVDIKKSDGAFGSSKIGPDDTSNQASSTNSNNSSTMADKEAARSVHHVDLKEKFDNQSLVGKERRNGYQHLLTEEQEQFLNSVEPSEQDKIFRKACHTDISPIPNHGLN